MSEKSLPHLFSIHSSTFPAARLDEENIQYNIDFTFSWVTLIIRYSVLFNTDPPPVLAERFRFGILRSIVREWFCVFHHRAIERTARLEPSSYRSLKFAEVFQIIFLRRSLATVGLAAINVYRLHRARASWRGASPCRVCEGKKDLWLCKQYTRSLEEKHYQVNRGAVIDFTSTMFARVIKSTSFPWAVFGIVYVYSQLIKARDTFPRWVLQRRVQ